MKVKKDYLIVNIDENELIEFRKTVGKNVARVRKERNLSQLDLSHMIGLNSVSLISGAEVYFNNIKLNLDHIYKISKALDTDICEFFKPIK